MPEETDPHLSEVTNAGLEQRIGYYYTVDTMYPVGNEHRVRGPYNRRGFEELLRIRLHIAPTKSDKPTFICYVLEERGFTRIEPLS